MRAGSKLSLGYIRSRANRNMRSTCRIERVEPPTYDDLSGLATAGTRTTVYEGICRIWEASGAGLVQVGEEDIPIQTTQLSIPWDTTPVPQRDDEVQILTSEVDDHLVGRRFRILDVSKAGDLRPSRRFSIQGVQESGSWP